MGLAARARVQGAVVSGWDTDDDAVARALERGAVDRACGSVAEAMEGAQACFVCAPVAALPALA